MAGPWTAYRPDWATPNARALVAGCRACTKPRPPPAGRRRRRPPSPTAEERPRAEGPLPADQRSAGQNGEPAHHPDPRGRRGDPAEQEGADHHAERHGRHQQSHGQRAAVQRTRVRRGQALGDDAKACQQPNSSRVSSMPLPKTTRIPAADTDHREGRAVPSRPRVGRALTPNRTMRADMPNVAASMPRVLRGSRMATTAAPATKPRIWLA